MCRFIRENNGKKDHKKRESHLEKRDSVMSTEELEKYIDHWLERNWEKPKSGKIFFKEGFANSAEGTYIFEKEGKYHYLITEKGRVYQDDVTNDIDEIKWKVLNYYIFYDACDYARVHQGKDQDSFRRLYFQRELEICRMFGDAFYLQKKKEIDGILGEHPYKDDFLRG